MNHRKITITLLALFFLFSATCLVMAQSKTPVTGTWKMNAEKSKFERGGPKNISIKFDQQGTTLRESLTITNDQGDRTLDFTYTLDGKESAQQLEGMDIKASAKWEGEALILEFKNDQGFSFWRKINVSGDGKTMTIEVKQANPNGSATDTVVLEKQ